MSIIEEALKEREYQDTKWGTDFDDKNTINDWCTYVVMYLAKAVAMENTKEEQRKMLVKAFTLLLAALQSFDRNGGFPNRHYDK